MKNFNTKRMWQVLKYDLLINRRQNLATFAKIALAFFVMFFFMFIVNTWYYPDGRVGEITDESAVVVVFAIVISTVFYGSWILRHMDTKQHRTAYLMLPASPAEKMVARLLITVVLWPLACMVAIVAADVLRWLIHVTLQMGLNGTVTLPALRIFCYNPWQAIVISILGTLWAQSLYIAGGALFTRRQWLLTGTALLILAMGGGGMIARAWEYMFDEALNKGITIDGDIVFWAFACKFTLFTLLNYWISYRIFRRTQVINNKWLNV